MILSRKKIIIWTKKRQFKQPINKSWSSTRWIKSQLDKIKASKKRKILDRNEKIIFELLNKKSKINKLLDIGGGLGSIYYSLVKKKINLDYYILEDSKFIDKIKKIKLKKINYIKKIPDKKFDIVLLLSSLHYIKNWKNLLKKILKNNPDYIAIIDLPVVNIPTFYGYQKYYSQEIKYRFQNKKDFKLFFKNTKYILIKNIINLKSKVNQKKYFNKNFFNKKLFKIKSETFIFKHSKNKKLV